MWDDPRWGDDPRERDDNSRDLSRGSRGGSDPRDRERTDPRDVFMDHVDLPRGLEREHVHYLDHDYTLRGSETRTLTTVGAFRVVPADDLRDAYGQSLDPRNGELWHLRESGLVDTHRLDRDTTVVTLTREGRELLEARRHDDDSRDRQAFHAGIQKPRELTHDAQVYRAYLREAERLQEQDAHIHRIVLENELKREYQEFLQERNRDREDSDGRPDREVDEIRAWALEHDLPCDDEGHVQFPDLRIEYDMDGRDHTLDVEVFTPHYRGAHSAAKANAGFACYRGGGSRLSVRGGISGGGRRGGGRDGRGLAEELFR
jgi:DNA-binding PadR family transcriptional regulator